VVPKGQVFQAIEGFAAMGAETLTITGGEPLTHPEWIDLLCFACSRPGVKEVRLQTNAILLTSSHLDALAALADCGLIIQTSLEGATSRAHDRVRGPGSFEATIKGLRLLLNSGFGSQLCVTFTEMEHNFEELPDLLEMVDRMGIGEFASGTLVYGGRAKQGADLQPPTPRQYEKLITRYQLDHSFRERYQRIGNIAALEWAAATSDPGEPCCTFIERPYVTTEGLLYPCVFLHADDYAATEAYERPLTLAILEKIDSWSRLQQIQHSRLSQLETCKDCGEYARCGGGCMGRAYAAHGSFLAAEDRCSLRKAVYGWQSAVR
jgi:radical SAM protein with 4Fe4S-binding SPASM domain